jgi:nitrite reductase/ring-hydroxylating ferredoxin subunit
MRLAELDPAQPVGTIAPIEVEGAAMVAIHTASGWVLTADRCPHAHCPFTDDGELADDGTLICNCHGSEFDPLSGELLLGPAQVGLVIRHLRIVRNALALEPRPI